MLKYIMQYPSIKHWQHSTLQNSSFQPLQNCGLALTEVENHSIEHHLQTFMTMVLTEELTACCHCLAS